jgi:hypothetical protein
MGNEWARLFGAGRTCNRFMHQPACERVACERIGGVAIANCAPLSSAVQRSFAGAVVEEVVIRGSGRLPGSQWRDGAVCGEGCIGPVMVDRQGRCWPGVLRVAMPTAIDNGQRSPRKLLAAVVRRLLPEEVFRAQRFIPAEGHALPPLYGGAIEMPNVVVALNRRWIATEFAADRESPVVGDVAGRSAIRSSHTVNDDPHLSREAFAAHRVPSTVPHPLPRTDGDPSA